MWTKNSAYYLMPLSIFIRTLFFFNYVLSSVIKCSSMMRKSRRAVWIWCCVDCLRNFLWDYLQLFPCLFYFYLDLQNIRISSDLSPHVVDGREILNVWCYFLFSCSDEVASIMSGLMKIVYDFTCNLLSRSYVFRLYFFFFFSSGLQISILSLLLKIK